MSEQRTSPANEHDSESSDYLARRVLFAFVVTFAASRTLVFLIMSRHIPNLFLLLRGTHVHHLNYGIFLLAAVGGYAILRRPTGSSAEGAALIYGLALGLTFDEFGMWLHLGGSYWQRASVDAVIVVGGVLGLVAYVPSFEHLRAHHRVASLILLIVVVAFAFVLWEAGNHIGHLVGPRLQELEFASSP